MYIYKILKRKDASSVVLAVVLAIVTASFLSSTLGSFSIDLVNSLDLKPAAEIDFYSSGDLHWSDAYLRPAIQWILSVLILEVGTGFVVSFRSMISKK